MLTLLILAAIVAATVIYLSGDWLDALRSWANKPRPFTDEWPEPHSI